MEGGGGGGSHHHQNPPGRGGGTKSPPLPPPDFNNTKKNQIKSNQNLQIIFKSSSNHLQNLWHLPSYPTLPYPTLPYPTLPYPTLQVKLSPHCSLSLNTTIKLMRKMMFATKTKNKIHCRTHSTSIISFKKKIFNI